MAYLIRLLFGRWYRVAYSNIYYTSLAERPGKTIKWVLIYRLNLWREYGEFNSDKEWKTPNPRGFKKTFK